MAHRTEVHSLMAPTDTPSSPEFNAPSPRRSTSAALALADGWVTHLARWSPQASRKILEFAHQGSLATSAGQVCLRLPEDGGPEIQQALLGSGLARMSADKTITPLVIDPAGRVYLARFHDLETRLARRIIQALHAPRQELPHPILEQLAVWFDTTPEDRDNEQLAAVRMAMRNRLTLISGGPGTGKTTTLVNLLAGLLLQNSELRIALAAPTGKAAARMLEALATRSSHLPDSIQVRLPRQASTLHRLIGATKQGGPTRFDTRHPLPLDVLVIDEASMIDLALTTQVLEALPEPARIILLGDRHQLAAVEAGAVFAELAQPGPTLNEHVATLTQSYRFAADSSIGRLAQAARDGLADQAHAQLGQAGLDWIDLDDRQAMRQIMHRVEVGLQAYLASLHSGLSRALTQDSLSAMEQALLSFRVLCAVRQGPFGTERLNTEISDWLRRQVMPHARPGPTPAWFIGRILLVTRNDPATGLVNGDLGITLPNDDGVLRVYFPHQFRQAIGSAEATTGYPSLTGLPIERLPDHETAFAMTVHKAQGSEFDDILFVLGHSDSPILTRELLYTGITRAKRNATLATNTSCLRAATERPTERLSGLAEQIHAGLRLAAASYPAPLIA
jgi:exodeoxyribonuclease V alpha subunit